MDDQASGLRKLLGQAPDLHAVGLFGGDAGLTARATAALAGALTRRGAALWVLDELPPPTNVAAQFGIHVGMGLGDLANGIVLPGDVLHGVDGGARFLGVPGGVRGLAEVDQARWQALLQGLEALPNRPEWLLIHADASRCAHSIALMAETRILITQARKPALTDAYGLLKIAEQSHPGRRWQVLMMNVGEMEPAMQAFERLADTARRFLGVELELLGMAPRDARLEQASRQMRPLFDLAPHGPAAQAFRRIADSIFEQIGDKAFQWHDFWQKMWLFSRTHAHLPREHGMQTRSDRRAW